MKILGMRNLKSKGILPIKRAYIKIDLNTMKELGEEHQKKRVYEILPKESGENPDISTIVTIPLNLPSDIHFCP